MGNKQREEEKIKHREFWNDALNNPFDSRIGLIIFSANTVVIVLSMINVILSTIWDYVDSAEDRTRFVLFDFITNVYFIVEWGARIYYSDDRPALCKTAVFWLEGLSNLVIFVDLEFLLTTNNNWIVSGWVPLFCTLRCLRLCRLYWHSFQLQLAWQAVHKAKDSLIMMGVLTTVSLIIIANVMFFAEILSCELRADNIRYYISGPELGNRCAFQNVFDALWFSISTITTTGSTGDMIPKTTQGKLFASFVMLLAIIHFTFPITIIAAHLTEVYLTDKQTKRFHKNNVLDQQMDDSSLSKALIKKCEKDIALISEQLAALNAVLGQVSKIVDEC